MKRTLSLLLALMLLLAMAPAVLADVLWIPEDPFLNRNMGDCAQHGRSYYAAGPGGEVVVYKSPESAVVTKKLENGEIVHISWDYTDENGTVWGFCEYWDDSTDWTGWMPLEHLLLRYDHISFREEFGSRITEEEGTLEVSGAEVRFWRYPGSENATTIPVEGDYLPEYFDTFTDDAGRKWGHIGYYMGIRNVWICLDDPTADYDTLYAEHPPQQVTHPVQENPPAEIKPAGPDLPLVLLAVCAVAAVSGGFLWATRKKK